MMLLLRSVCSMPPVHTAKCLVLCQTIFQSTTFTCSSVLISYELVVGLRDHCQIQLWCKPHVLVSMSAITNHNKPGGLKQKFIPSQSWRADVSNQGVGRVVLPLKALGEIPCLPLPASEAASAPCHCITPISAGLHVAFSFTWAYLIRTLHSPEGHLLLYLGLAQDNQDDLTLRSWT